MIVDGTLEEMRYRAVRNGLLFLVPCCLFAAASIHANPIYGTPELGLFLLASLVGVAGLFYTHRAYYQGRPDHVNSGGCLVALLATVLLTERIVAGLYIAPLGPHVGTIFLPSFAFLPLICLFGYSALPAPIASRIGWGVWGLTVLVAAPALWSAMGIGFDVAGIMPLTAFLLGGMPFFLRWIQMLPRVEDAMAQHAMESDELRKRAELTDQLRESERRFNLVVQSLQVGAWDRRVGEDSYRWWSPRFHELVGYSPEELPPGDDSLQRIIHPDDRQRVLVEASEQLRTGDVTDIDFRIMTKDRGYRWFNSAAKAVRDEQGEVIRLAGAIADIHDRRVAEKQLIAAKDQLTQMAYRDTLTDLHNRRYFDEQFAMEVERAKRYKRPLSLLIADIDFFKAYNDRYGHADGDQCLISLAHRMSESLARATDFVARLGGEEFAILLPETDAAGARGIAIRFLGNLADAKMRHDGSPNGFVTVSIGIASIGDSGEDVTTETLFTRADQAMYRVKQGGRNGFRHFDD